MPYSRTTCFTLSFLGFMTFGIAETLIGPALPFIREEFNISLGIAGFLASLSFVGYLFTICGGIFSDRFGELPVISISFALTGSALGLISIASNYQVLSVIFLFIGIGAGFIQSSVNPLITRLYPKRPGTALNFIHIAFSVGAFIGPIMSGFLIANYQSWRLPYSILSIMYTSLFFMGIILILKGKKSKRSVISYQSKIQYSKMFPLVLLILGMFFYTSSELGVNTWLPSFLFFEREYTITSASLITSLFFISLACGRLILGSITDNLGFKRMVLYCSIVSALSIFVAILMENRYLIYFFWIISGFAFGPIGPTIIAWTNRLFPSKRGFASGFLFSLGMMGAVFSPWFIGSMAEIYSLRLSILFLALSISIPGLLSLIIIKK